MQTCIVGCGLVKRAAGCVFSRYHRVQSALTQQNSELQDTRMLTEFLERVELEESQELNSSRYSLGQVSRFAQIRSVMIKGEFTSFVCFLT